MQYFDKNRKLVAVLHRKEREPGLEFVTEESQPLQVGVMYYPNGNSVRLHKHTPPGEVTLTQEVLYVESGGASVEITDDNWAPLARFDIRQGDILIFCAGGHQLNIWPNTKIVEVKQGPYSSHPKEYKD